MLLGNDAHRGGAFPAPTGSGVSPTAPPCNSMDASNPECRRGGEAAYVGGRVSDVRSLRPREVETNGEDKPEEEEAVVCVVL